MTALKEEHTLTTYWNKYTQNLEYHRWITHGLSPFLSK